MFGIDNRLAILKLPYRKLIASSLCLVNELFKEVNAGVWTLPFKMAKGNFFVKGSKIMFYLRPLLQLDPKVCGCFDKVNFVRF